MPLPTPAELFVRMRLPHSDPRPAPPDGHRHPQALRDCLCGTLFPSAHFSVSREVSESPEVRSAPSSRTPSSPESSEETPAAAQMSDLRPQALKPSSPQPAPHRSAGPHSQGAPTACLSHYMPHSAHPAQNPMSSVLPLPHSSH